MVSEKTTGEEKSPVTALPDKAPHISIWSSLERGIHRFSRSIRWVSIAVLFFMMVFVAVDVFGRYVLNKSIQGDIELQELMMVLIVFLAFPFCTLEKRNIYVELLIDRLKGRPKAILNSFASLIGMAIIIVIIWQIALRGWTGLTATSGKELTLLLNIPIAPFILVATLGLVFMGLEWLIDLIHSIRKATGWES